MSRQLIDCGDTACIGYLFLVVFEGVFISRAGKNTDCIQPLNFHDCKRSTSDSEKNMSLYLASVQYTPPPLTVSRDVAY